MKKLYKVLEKGKGSKMLNWINDIFKKIHTRILLRDLRKQREDNIRKDIVSKKYSRIISPAEFTDWIKLK